MTEPAIQKVAPVAPKRRPRPALVAALCLLALLAAGLAWWVFGEGTFADQVEERVKAGIPAGTDRATAEAWISQSFSVLANHSPPARLPRRSIMTLAEVPDNVPGGVLWFTAARKGFIGESLSRVRPDHVWVFLFLDEDGRNAAPRYKPDARAKDSVSFAGASGLGVRHGRPHGLVAPGFRL